MPKPKPSNPAAAAAGEGGPVDPEWKYFLDNVQEEPSGSYSVKRRADGASSLRNIEYEKASDRSHRTNGEPRGAAAATAACRREEARKRTMEKAKEKAKEEKEKETEKGKNAVPAWHDVNPNIEECYRVFLQHVRVEEGYDLVLDYNGMVVRYGGQEGNDAGICKPPVKAEPEVVIISSDEDEPCPLNRRAPPQKPKNVKKVQVGKGKNVKKAAKIVEEHREVVKDVEANEKAEKLVNIPKKKKVKIVTKDKEKDQEPDGVISGGVIWPTHINKREESDFKLRLMHVLRKPFSQEEYDELFGMATIRHPVTKERRTRCGVKYYKSKHEMGKSYFDRYPDLAKQVEETSHPNRLALLRGLFFWLENVGQEDQFRPWRGDHTLYKVTYF